mmetsp:Transcript_20486/g.58247  ORF Transcript_20486/g.58247 Transcript_20486/m.58247 type:complete len:114 (-) Transcript_20486:2471-2812(-)
MKAMRSAFRTVVKRCAMRMHVFSLDSMSLSSASWTTDSLSLSNADVASSRRRIGGFLTSARAIAIRCFWPPDTCVPRSPTGVSKPSGNVWMKSNALACRAASSICLREAPGAP